MAHTNQLAAIIIDSHADDRDIATSDDAESKRWALRAAPTRHRFCLVGPSRTTFDTNANEWGDA